VGQTKRQIAEQNGKFQQRGGPADSSQQVSAASRRDLRAVMGVVNDVIGVRAVDTTLGVPSEPTDAAKKARTA